MVGVISSEMRHLLVADVTVLRNVYTNYSADGGHVDLIYALENHSEGWMPPPQAKWIGQHELQNLNLKQPEHRA